MNTKVHLVTLYTKAYPIIFYVTDWEMINVHNMMELKKKSRGNISLKCWSDLGTLQNNPDKHFILDLDGSVVFGYSFLDVGYFEETHEELAVAEGIH